MTVPATQRRVGPFSGNGVTTSFPFSFKCFTADDFSVTLISPGNVSTLLQRGVDYSVTLNADQISSPGGTIVYPLTGSPMATGYTLTGVGALAYDQTTSFPQGGSYRATTHENALDRIVSQIQQLVEWLGRAITVQVGDTAGTFPTASQRANSQLLFDANGQMYAGAPVTGSAADVLLRLISSTVNTWGPALIGLDQTLAYSAGTLGKHVAQEFWNPCNKPWNMPTDGVSDCTSALNSCIAEASAAGAGIRIPAGTFLVNSAILRNNTHIRGAGQGKTVLKQISGANDLWHTIDPGSATTFTSNITIEDLTLQGTVAVDGFQEVLHLMFTQGAKNVTIERVTFSGWRGDALYIGTGNERGQNPTQIRHNQNVRVLNCVFDGETKNNRNAISFIDCDTALVTGCYFTRCSKSDMPGCVDIEPDSGGTPNGTSSIIRNITVMANKFYDNAGAATVALNFPQSLALYATPIYNIAVLLNDIDNLPTYGTVNYGIGISVFGSLNVSRSIEMLGVRVRNNTVKNVYSPFFVRAARGVEIRANNFGTSMYSAEIGDVTGSTVSLDLEVRDNVFSKVSSDNTVGANALVLYQGLDNVAITGNYFDACGKANNGYNCNISLQGGTKTAIAVEDNVFYSPVANANSWDVRLDSGALTAGTIRHVRNRLINVNGGTVGFVNDYTPPRDTAALSLQNGWAQSGGNFALPTRHKDPSGRVCLEGEVTGSTVTAGSTLVSFPVGWRCNRIKAATAVGFNGSTWVPVYLQFEQTQGDLQFRVAATGVTRIDLSGISFYPEA